MVKIDIIMPTYCYDCPCHNGENGRCNITGASVFDKRPFDCPLRDVEEVRHGEWLEGNRWQPCSKCHKRGKRSWKYCPKCGARMDGKEKTE